MALNIPDGLYYTRDHEWARIIGDVAVIGITDYAQSHLEDIVFVELPKIGLKVSVHQSLGTIEAVKAVSDVFSPVSGEVIEANKNVEQHPDLCNKDPYGEGWIAKVKMADKKDPEKLLSPADYRALTAE
jgi:glycine cleavage system H protein